jgi:hypothetical protein
VNASQIIESNVHIVERAARNVAGRRDPELIEELVAIGNLALTEASQQFDPSTGEELQKFLYRRVRRAMDNELRRFAYHGRRVQRLDSPLSRDDPDGATVVTATADRRASDPATEVAAAESMLPAKRGYNSLRLDQVEVLAPIGVGDWAAKLRAATFNAVNETDMTEVMQAVVKRAKLGDLAAAKLLLDYMAGGRQGNVRQTIVVQSAARTES